MSERTAVYRLYDADDALLYVGISKSFGSRWEQHAYRQPWWPEVHRQTVEWHPDRECALAAEEAAICSEGPRYNVMHNPCRPRRTAAGKLEALSASATASVTGDLALLHSLACAHWQAQAQAKALTDPARDALIDAIWEAADQGMPQVEIVEDTGLTRERIRQVCLPAYRAAEMERRAAR